MAGLETFSSTIVLHFLTLLHDFFVVFSFRAPAITPHSNHLRPSSPSSSRLPSSSRSFLPGPEVSDVASCRIWIFVGCKDVLCNCKHTHCTCHWIRVISLLPSPLTFAFCFRPLLPSISFQPAVRPLPTAANRSLPPCKLGPDKQSILLARALLRVASKH